MFEVFASFEDGPRFLLKIFGKLYFGPVVAAAVHKIAVVNRVDKGVVFTDVTAKPHMGYVFVFPS